MNEIFAYLFKSIWLSFLMLLIYRVFLHNDTGFRFRRFYLLLALVLPAALPFIQIEEIHTPIAIPVIELPESIISGSAQNTSYSFVFDWISVCIGIGILLFYGFIFKLFRLYQTLKRTEKIQFGSLKVCFVSKEAAAWSFLNHLMIPFAAFQKTQRRGIIAHEMTHIREWHSVDVIFTEILCCLFWFNPFHWVFRNLILQNHEYLADKQSKMVYPDIQQYKIHLFESLTGIHIPLVSSFNHQHLKKRLQMLQLSQQKIRRPVISLLAGLSAITLLTASVFLFQKPLQAGIVQDQDDKNEMMASYPGGSAALVTYFHENLKYPENAKKNNITGVVHIQFFVNEDGHLSDFKVVNGIDPECDAEALRMLKGSGNWIPAKKEGKVVRSAYVLPIKFELGKEEEVAKFEEISVLPSFPGGESARIEYMQSRLKYPEEAKKNKIQGTVYISFLVKSDGSIHNVKVLRGIGGGCDELAIEMVRSMPNWNPGLNKNSQPVATIFNMPIKFSLNNPEEKQKK